MTTVRRTAWFCTVHLLAIGLVVSAPGALCAGLAAGERCTEAAPAPSCCCQPAAAAGCLAGCCATPGPERAPAPPAEKPPKLQTAFDAVSGSCRMASEDAAPVRNAGPASASMSPLAASLTLHGQSVRLQV